MPTVQIYSESVDENIRTRPSISGSDHDYVQKDGHMLKYSLLVVGFDISNLSGTLQFLVLFMGLVFFMCLYGLFQEIIVYELFNRKLSIFTTCIHFAGCLYCSLLLYCKERKSFEMLKYSSPLKHHVALSILKTLTHAFTNLSMQFINYPTKIICKSMLPVVTICLSYIRGKRYSIYEILSVLILSLGLLFFVMGDDFVFPEETSAGFFFVFLSLLTASATPIYQEYLSECYGTGSSEMLLFSYAGSFLICVCWASIIGEITEGINILVLHTTPFYFLCLLCFCTFGFLGANCSIGLTVRFGPLTNGICNCCRKFLSVLISLLSFPDRNHLDLTQITGIVLFAGSLIFRLIAKNSVSK